MSEKTEKPTARKLREARKKGEVHKSKEVTQLAIFIAILGLFALLSGFTLTKLQLLFTLFRDSLPSRDDDPQLLFRVLLIAERSFVALLAPVLAAVVLVGCLVGFLQVKSLFSFDPIKPKPERLNPGANLKNLFSSNTAIGFIKTLLQVAIVGAMVFSVIKGHIPLFLKSIGADPPTIFNLLMKTMQDLCLLAMAAYILMAGFDYGHQFYEYMKQQKMSKDDVKREYKDVEGDPRLKAQRKAFHRSLSQSSGANNMNRATVVVTNPTHYAIALRYERGSGDLPMVIAKGKDEAARLIREEAARLGIPLVENKVLARQLYAHVSIDRFIGPEHFADVARTILAASTLRTSTGSGTGV
jgi:type III secretion YscU/HrpY family protein